MDLPPARLQRVRKRLLAATRHVGAAPHAHIFPDGSKELGALAAAVGVSAGGAFAAVLRFLADWAPVIAGPPVRFRPRELGLPRPRG